MISAKFLLFYELSRSDGVKSHSGGSDEGMDPGLRRVTLEQLLSHTSGIPSDNDAFGDLLGKAMTQDGNLDEQRYWLVRRWGTQPLESEPGTKFAYANMNYTIVDAI